MADIQNTSPLAPVALPPSVQSSVYERKMAPDMPGGRGPLRFEEGLATDTDLPMEFVTGMRQGYVTGPRGHNESVYIKDAATTQRERVHVGSAAWVEAPTYLGAFAGGSGNEAEQNYIQVTRSGGHQARRSAAQVMD
jgi:hypothetical protein